MIIMTIIDICMAIIGLIAAFYLAFRVFVKWQGNERIVFNVKKATKFRLADITFDKVHLVAEVPYKNLGKQNGTIMDCFARAYLPQEQFADVGVEAWVCDVKRVRHDNYWEAVIIEPNKGGVLEVHLLLKGMNGNIREDAQNMPNMPIDIIAQIVGRSDWHMTKSRISLNPSDVSKALTM